MPQEIKFKKYIDRKSGYHWEQISNSLTKRNIFVIARYKIILNILGDNISGKKILDVGCGDGVLCSFLKKKGAIVTGIDASKEAIKFGKEKVKDVNFIEGSAYELPFEEGSFDYVISTELIEHLSEPEKLLTEMKKVWNKTGKVVISTPIKFTDKPLDKNHVTEYFEEEFKNLLKPYFNHFNIKISHPVFWMELMNKQLWNLSIFRIKMNFLNILFGFNPFMKGSGWRYFALQTAIINE